ncbi:hypothetical protein PF005_g26004 [Phytophthora fragariae]|uniref:Uncharacterized protein n=1 Tax=Phytophthora fragariae TaxID=53985 RepID=A0A6A3E4D3_9STRA|nr:hypothetical protein PF003_g39264 [Phytophthora fragariae]KAE8927306.1 hypothetical protein PF009_g22524 [Phytophthora fragariae]KAE8973772.1 hypothetical protein PF011_g25119 [Phytophthora fragariae]KAE9082168.1 hypothetical protein PF007_g22378 [Phytophthora fragariae]KAE9089093.1 hypothetical protein PF010_g19134 [Phytophthora fragariae]
MRSDGKAASATCRTCKKKLLSRTDLKRHKQKKFPCNKTAVRKRKKERRLKKNERERQRCYRKQGREAPAKEDATHHRAPQRRTSRPQVINIYQYYYVNEDPTNTDTVFV